MTSPRSGLTEYRNGHVVVLEIDRGPGNYFDAKLLEELAAAAIEAQSDGTCRAVVICSVGKHFCAGADFGSDDLKTDRESTARTLYRHGMRLFDIELPIVAAVQGAAVGGGLGLACVADFRVASSSSRFHANFARLGFHQGFGLTVTLPSIVGPQAALDLLTSARRVSGADAYRLGLVDRLVEEGEERQGALALAEEITQLAPLAVRAIRRTLRSDLKSRVEAALEHELHEQSWLWGTEDSEIGLAASLRRQKPTFRGR